MGNSLDNKNDVIEVLIVDDHPAIREALSLRLDQTMGIAVVGTCGSAREAMEVIDEDALDVLIVDISLEDAHGLDLVEQVQNVYPEIQIVVYSMYDEEVYAERAIRKGAKSYLMKSESTSKVVEAIRSADQGRVYLSEQMASRILNQLPRQGGDRTGFPIDTLTDRELAVFQMLGRGCTISEITDRLSLCRKTVETYRRRAKEKLNLESTNELLQFAVEWVHGDGQRTEQSGGEGEKATSEAV